MAENLVALVFKVRYLSIRMHSEYLRQVDIGQTMDVILNLICGLMDRAIVITARRKSIAVLID